MDGGCKRYSSIAQHSTMVGLARGDARKHTARTHTRTHATKQPSTQAGASGFAGGKKGFAVGPRTASCAVDDA